MAPHVSPVSPACKFSGFVQNFSCSRPWHLQARSRLAPAPQEPRHHIGQSELKYSCCGQGPRAVFATGLRPGASDIMLMLVMGWTNPSQAKVYTEKA